MKGTAASRDNRIRLDGLRASFLSVINAKYLDTGQIDVNTGERRGRDGGDLLVEIIFSKLIHRLILGLVALVHQVHQTLRTGSRMLLLWGWLR